jgi:hypothetical protein
LSPSVCLFPFNFSCKFSRCFFRFPVIIPFFEILRFFLCSSVNFLLPFPSPPLLRFLRGPTSKSFLPILFIRSASNKKDSSSARFSLYLMIIGSSPVSNICFIIWNLGRLG